MLTAQDTSVKETAMTDFFESRTITKAVQPKRKRKFVPPFKAGSLHKKSNTEILEASAQKAMDKQKNVESHVTPLKSTERKQSSKSVMKNTKQKSKIHV